MIFRALGWAKRILVWVFVRPWRTWLTLGISFGPIPFYLWATVDGASPEISVRWHGLALQLVGVLLVAKSLQDTAKRFQRATFWELVVEWVKSFPPYREAHRLNVDAARYEMEGGTVGFAVGRNFDASKPVEQRLAYIEHVLQQVETHTRSVTKLLGVEIQEVRRSLKKVSKAVSDGDEAIHAKLREQVADGLPEGYMGLFVLLCGTIYSGVPKHIIDGLVVRLLPGP